MALACFASEDSNLDIGVWDVVEKLKMHLLK
jgi:hypothetical protein